MREKQLELFDFFNEPNYLILSQVFPDSESDEIEYKSAQGGFPSEFWKTYSAFANSKGGIIVLGVKEKKNTFIVEGLEPELLIKYQKDFWNTLNNKSAVSLNLMSNDDVQVYTLEGHKVLAFKIPSASRSQKPVYLTSNPFQNTYKRNYEGDYKCTDEEVRRMLSDADLSFRPDSRILEGFAMDDFDLISIRQFRQIFASIKPAHNWLALDDRELLIQLGGYRVDRKTRKEGPTVAGILMFGKTSSITDEECCPKFFPDYRELLSENPDERWSDRIYPDGTWESNLFQFYRLVWPKLSSRLPKPFQISKGQRQDETPAHIALREAFVNALIHADYSAPGNIVIESKPDVFRFTNPGTLLVTISQYYHGGISECRNTSLQKMFLMIGSAEKAGSGVGKILSGWDYAHWRTPYISIETIPDRLVLELPMFSILPEDTLTDLRELFGESVDALGKHELTILAACHIEGDITNSRLQFMLDRHKTDITKILQELCKSGYLISENKSRWTTYHLNTDFNKNPAIEISNLDSSEDSVKNLTPNVDTLTPNVDTLTPNIDTLTPNSDTRISNIEPLVTKKRRLSKDEIEAIIIHVCKNVFLTKEQIAQKIERKPDYIQNQILPDMIKTGKLVYQFPDNINHPNQAYKSE